MSTEKKTTRKRKSVSRKRSSTAQFPFRQSTDMVTSVILALLIFVNIGLMAQVLGGFTLSRFYQEQLTIAEAKESDLQGRIIELEYDRVRIEDTTNVLLALQDYHFTEGTFPQRLFELVSEEYLPSTARLHDPVSRHPYYYRALGDEGFVLCAWLSDMIKGSHTTDCPAGTETTGFDETFDVDFTEGFDVQPEIITAEGASEETTAYVRVTADGIINIRAFASPDADIVARAVQDQEFEWLEEEGEWTHVRVSPITQGWVFSEFLTKLEVQ